MLTLDQLIQLAEQEGIDSADFGQVTIQFTGLMGQPNDAEFEATNIATSEDGSAVITIGAGI
jgi:hypothetical protein